MMWIGGDQCSQSEAFQQSTHLEHAIVKTLVRLHRLGRALEAVDDRGVIASTERVADLHELQAEHLSAEPHGDLPRNGERLGARLRLESIDRDAPFFRDG